MPGLGPAPTPDVLDVHLHTIELINPEGETRLYTFDLADRLISRFVQSDPQGGGLLTSYAYDGNGPLDTITFPNGNVIALGHDKANRRTSASDTIGAIYALTWDKADNLLTYADGKGNVTSNGYDAADRRVKVKDALGNLEFYEHDENGNLILFTDREGKKTKYEYDDLDRLTVMFEDWEGLNRKTGYTYDGFDRILSLTAYVGTNGTGTAQTTTYEYDGAGRLKKAIYPDDGGTGVGTVEYTYTPAGRILARTDQKDVVTTYGYSDRHRLTSRSYSDGLTPAETFAYDKAGRLTSATSSVAALVFGYDDAGRLLDADQTVNSVPYHTDLLPEVSATLNRLTLNYPGQSTGIVKSFDKRDRLNGVTYGAQGLITSSTYDLADRMTVRALGNGVQSTHQYNPNSWVELIDYVKSAVSLEKLAYGYSNAGNVKYRQVQTPNLTQFSELYGYDGLHRLASFGRGVLNGDKTAVVTPIGKPFVQSQAWNTLDMLGNWISTATTIDAVASTDARAINNVNEYLTRTVTGSPQVTLASDHNGNLTDDGTQLYEYDGENRLTRVKRKSPLSTLQEYKYDPLGRRVKTIDSSPAILPEYPSGKTTTHVYAGGPECLAEYDSTTAEGGTRERWFVHGQGFPDPLLIADLTALGDLPVGQTEYLYYLKDLLGSVTALADAAGKVVERYVFDPYGKTTVTYADGIVQLPPLAKSYYHDSDLDGDIDQTDSNHLTACLATAYEPMCVFVHDRNGDDRVDAQDQGMFVGQYTGTPINPAPPAWLRPATAYFDANGDKELGAFDWLAYHTCFGMTTGSNLSLCRFVEDLEHDNTIDLGDYAEFQLGYGGPGVPRSAGSVTTGSSRFGNPFTWTGQRYDPAVGLYHFKYRSYSSTLGRWLQRDPLGYVDAATLYELLLSNPTVWIDPFGLIKRDKDGKPVITPVPDDPRNPGPLEPERTTDKIPIEIVTIEADDGTPITGARNTGSNRQHDSNCHGLTFADGLIWISPDDVDNLLKGDDYTIVGPKDKPRPGDIIVYRDKDKIPQHSATVIEVDKDGRVVKVRSKDGPNPVMEVPPGPGKDTAWPNTNDKTEIRRRPSQPTTRSTTNPSSQPR